MQFFFDNDLLWKTKKEYLFTLQMHSLNVVWFTFIFQ